MFSFPSCPYMRTANSIDALIDSIRIVEFVLPCEFQFLRHRVIEIETVLQKLHQHSTDLVDDSAIVFAGIGP